MSGRQRHGGRFLPPLLESQISPPHSIITRHMEYLQKWRQYLATVWTNDWRERSNHLGVQRAIDDLISAVLLIDFVEQTDAAAVPSVKAVLDTVTVPTAFNLLQVVHDQVSCPLLREIFDPTKLAHPDVMPQGRLKWSAIAQIAEASEVFYGSRMPITVFGDFYQCCISHAITPDETRVPQDATCQLKGVHYTPAPVVDYLIAHTLGEVCDGANPRVDEGLRILDPACGYGAFLLAALRYLLHLQSNRAKGCISNSYPQQALNLLSSSLIGVDIDKQAVTWTRRLLLMTVWDHLVHRCVSARSIRSLTMPDMRDTIICGDFLELPPRHARLCEPKADIVVGSPPFVRIQQLKKSGLIERYRHKYKTAHAGQFDLYMLFIERSIQLLVDEGLLAMSVSSSFLRSRSGRGLRLFVADTCSVKEIVEFEDSRVYPNARVPIALLVIRKTTRNRPATRIAVGGRGGLRRKLGMVHKGQVNSSVQAAGLPVDACRSGNWTLQSENEKAFLSQIEHHGTPLAGLPVAIRLGIATGADDVFLLRNAEELESGLVVAESRLLADVFGFESSAIRPILRGRHIREYLPPSPETLCVFPYSSTGRIIAEDKLRGRYPLVHRYLSSCRERLNARQLSRQRPWYAFAGGGLAHVMKSPKLVASVTTTGGGFALDHYEHTLCGSSTVLLCPDSKVVDIYYLLGILNSAIFRFWVRCCMPTLGLGWYSYRVDTIRRFPIPMPRSHRDRKRSSDISEIVSSLVHGSTSNAHRIKALSTIDHEVQQMYDITDIVPYERH